MNAEIKYKVISLLQADVPAKDIAEDLNLSYGAVLKLRRDFEQAKMNNTIDELLGADELLLIEAGKQIQAVPEYASVVQDEITKLTDKLQGLEHLSDELQQTALLINTRARSLILSIDHVSELEVITEILCKLQTSFVNKNMTQVNVQNNFGNDGAPKYTQFLGDKPSE